MIMQKVTYCGPGALRALGLRAGQSRVVPSTRLTPALLQRYSRYLIIQDARTRVASFVGHAVRKRHLAASKALVNGTTERQARPLTRRRPETHPRPPVPEVEAREIPVEEPVEVPSEETIETEDVEVREDVAAVDVEAKDEAVADVAEEINYEELPRKKLVALMRERGLEPKRAKSDCIAALLEADAE